MINLMPPELLIGHIYYAYGYELEILDWKPTPVDNTRVRIVGREVEGGVWITYNSARWDYLRPGSNTINKEYALRLDRWDN